jgi:uncharacterized tellurite resistance protein B-like protein
MNQESGAMGPPELSPIEILSFLLISVITADGEATENEIDCWRVCLINCVGSGDPDALTELMKGTLELHRHCAEQGVVADLTFQLADELKKRAPEEQLEASLSLLARASRADGEVSPEADELVKKIQWLWFGASLGAMDALLSSLQGQNRSTPSG